MPQNCSLVHILMCFTDESWILLHWKVPETSCLFFWNWSLNVFDLPDLLSAPSRWRNEDKEGHCCQAPCYSGSRVSHRGDIWLLCLQRLFLSVGQVGRQQHWRLTLVVMLDHTHHDFLVLCPSQWACQWELWLQLLSPSVGQISVLSRSEFSFLHDILFSSRGGSHGHI